MIALIALSFMLLSMQVWMRTFERADENSAAKFKGEAIRLVLASLSDESLSQFANASAFFATYKLANYTAYTGLTNAPAGDDTDNPNTGKVEQTIIGLMKNGSAEPEAGKRINYTESEMESYTLVSWKGKINRAANLMGFKVNLSDPQNITIRQINAWTVGVSFDVDMTVEDLEGAMHQSKRMHADSNFSIDGFPDPSITRNDIKQRKPTPLPENAEQKQVFHNINYADAGDLAPSLVASMDEGNGWFFGPMTDSRPGTGIFTNLSEQSRMWQYVLVTDYYDGLVDDANLYGAVILTEAPGMNVTHDVVHGGCPYNQTDQTNCLNCRRSFQSSVPSCSMPDEYFNIVSVPFVAGGGFSADNVKEIPRAGMDAQRKFVLIDNTYGKHSNKWRGDHAVWDLWKIRDMTICGFYLENPVAPSFFQRMLNSVGNSTAGTVHSKYGIETILTGQWAGGKDDGGYGSTYEHDSRSRLDWQFYSATDYPAASTTVWKVKGMAGCRDETMCSTMNATKEATGKFRMPGGDIERYGLKKMACKLDVGTPTSYCEPGHD